MEKQVYESEEISLQEIIFMIWKNKLVIATFVLIGLILSLILSGVQALNNPVTNQYQSKVTLELVNGQDLSNQPQTVLHVASSNQILATAKGKLQINSDDYQIKTQEATKPNQFDIIATGPDQEQVVKLAEQVVNETRAVIGGAVPLATNAVVEKSRLFGDPIQMNKQINFGMNSAIGIVLGLMLGVFYVFIMRYMSGKLHTEEELETALNVKVLSNVYINNKPNGLKKYVQVR